MGQEGPLPTVAAPAIRRVPKTPQGPQTSRKRNSRAADSTAAIPGRNRKGSRPLRFRSPDPPHRRNRDQDSNPAQVVDSRGRNRDSQSRSRRSQTIGRPLHEAIVRTVTARTGNRRSRSVRKRSGRPQDRRPPRVGRHSFSGKIRSSFRFLWAWRAPCHCWGFSDEGQPRNPPKVTHAMPSGMGGSEPGSPGNRPGNGRGRRRSREGRRALAFRSGGKHRGQTVEWPLRKKQKKHLRPKIQTGL